MYDIYGLNINVQGTGLTKLSSVQS